MDIMCFGKLFEDFEIFGMIMTDFVSSQKKKTVE